MLFCPVKLVEKVQACHKAHKIPWHCTVQYIVPVVYRKFSCVPVCVWPCVCLVCGQKTNEQHDVSHLRVHVLKGANKVPHNAGQRPTRTNRARVVEEFMFLWCAGICPHDVTLWPWASCVECYAMCYACRLDILHTCVCVRVVSNGGKPVKKLNPQRFRCLRQVKQTISRSGNILRHKHSTRHLTFARIT